MKIELKFFTVLIFLFCAVVASLITLFNKYRFLTFEHFIDTCKRAISSITAHGIHAVAIAVISFVIITAFIFCIKSLFSLIKHHKKLNQIAYLRNQKYPSKLLKIIKKHNIDINNLIVIDLHTDFAATIGILQPKIVISTGLINKLAFKELEIIVFHELYHKHNFHGLFLILGEVVSSTLFFLPFIHDFIRNMRGLLEKEADIFAINSQGSEVHLNLAFSKVHSTNLLSVYPNFSKRMTYKIRKLNIFISLAVIFLGVALFLVPTQSMASNLVSKDRCGAESEPMQSNMSVQSHP